MARITIPYAVADFVEMRERNFYYVDKTDFIPGLEDYKAPVFLRPRRFGKSLLVSTLEAYFLGKKELFNGLDMEQLEKDWTVYPVLHIDFRVTSRIYQCSAVTLGKRLRTSGRRRHI